MRVGVLHEERAAAARLGRLLADAGHAAQIFADGLVLEAEAQGARFDVLLLQWRGAPLSGVGLMHRLRGRMAPAPAMILLVDDGAPVGVAETADAQLEDPCTPAALQIALQNVAARRGPIGAERHDAGQLLFDAAATTVHVRGVPVQLTAKEFALAQYLVRNIGVSLSRARIMMAVWGRDDKFASRTLDAHIARVRRCLLLRPEHGWRLSSVYGFGYRLDRLEPPAAPVTAAGSAAIP